MNARSYTVIAAGPQVNIHTAEAIAEGFASVAEAHAWITENKLARVQVVAETRRFLTDREYQELSKACVETGAAA